MTRILEVTITNLDDSDNPTQLFFEGVVDSAGEPYMFIEMMVDDPILNDVKDFFVTANDIKIVGKTAQFTVGLPHPFNQQLNFRLIQTMSEVGDNFFGWLVNFPNRPQPYNKPIQFTGRISIVHNVTSSHYLSSSQSVNSKRL